MPCQECCFQTFILQQALLHCYTTNIVTHQALLYINELKGKKYNSIAIKREFYLIAK